MMKTKLIMMVAAGLILFGCKKEIKLDVRHINETDKTELWDISITRSVFSSTETTVENSVTVFNDEVSGLVNGIKAGFMEQAQENAEMLASNEATMTGALELIINDSVLLADENHISIRVQSYQFPGGAHGMTNFYGINYNVKTKTFLNKEDIIDNTKAADINKLLASNLKNTENCFTETPTIDDVAAINFTLNRVLFTYEAYVLGPYACGYTTIQIPRSKMQGMLKIK